MRQREESLSQSSLFSSGDLVVPSSSPLTIKKSISAIQAVPASAGYTQTSSNRRLFDACIVVAQLHCKKRDKRFLERVREERISPLFEVRIADLVHIASIPGKNYERTYRELDLLYDVTMLWNILDEDDNEKVEWKMRAHFLSSLGYGLGKKKGIVRFSFDPAVLELVLEPTRWATLALTSSKASKGSKSTEQLGTGPTYALYQNTFRYIGTFNKVTAIWPTETWIELLMGGCRYLEVDSEGNKRAVNYGDFKRRVLTPSILRINELQALAYTIELKEYLFGSRVAKLQFKFIRKAQEPLGIPLTWTPDILRSLESLGYNQQGIEDLSQSYSNEEVADAVLRMKSAETSMREKGRVITSKRAYFEGILRNVAEGAAAADIDQEAAVAAAQKQEAERAAEARQERLKEAFQAHQKERFTTWLFGLPEAGRLAYLDLFKASPDFTPPVRGILEKGLTVQNASAIALLRVWLVKTYPELMDNVLSNPEDKTFDAWMAWRLENSGA